jgi:hypothetical protein
MKQVIPLRRQYTQCFNSIPKTIDISTTKTKELKEMNEEVEVHELVKHAKPSEKPRSKSIITVIYNYLCYLLINRFTQKYFEFLLK